ncbi:MAG: metal-dependent hydrolase [Magnetococcales bacterium]|nr:metal-dependent hydrolase [Magnetococcales bacterium]
MAGFQTHLTTASVAGGMAAAVLLIAGAASPGVAGLCFFAAVLGGLAPDLDAPDSTPLRLAFTAAGGGLAFLAIAALADHWSLAELTLLGGGIFLFTRDGLRRLFVRFTEHRGVFHSLPAVVLAGCLATLLGVAAGADPRFAWLAGGFFAGGYLTHLLLDEWTSLNIWSVQPKSSLGGAIKLYSRHGPSTLLLYLAMVAAWWMTPPLSDSFSWDDAGKVVQAVGGRLFPDGQWFILP